MWGAFGLRKVFRERQEKNSFIWLGHLLRVTGFIQMWGDPQKGFSWVQWRQNCLTTGDTVQMLNGQFLHFTWINTEGKGQGMEIMQASLEILRITVIACVQCSALFPIIFEIFDYWVKYVPQ